MNTLRSTVAFVFACAACGFAAKPAQAAFIDRTCLGNIETFDRKIIQAGVTYKLSFAVSGASAEVRFAGRAFNVAAERGASWKGVWLKRMDTEVYFSFLPDEGGTIKFQFEPNRWYSGNC